jgi:hypothetical protein
MAPGLFEEWREERRLRRNATAFVRELLAEPSAADVEWLAKVATDGDADRARWELRYGRRAIGLLIAQRGALDDRTGSAVSREVAASLANDRNVGAGMARLVERQFNERLSRYRDALAERASAAPTATRLGRTLLLVAGAGGTLDEPLVRHAAEVAGRYSTEAAEALRRIFGTAELREDLPPSAQLPGRR